MVVLQAQTLCISTNSGPDTEWMLNPGKLCLPVGIFLIHSHSTPSAVHDYSILFHWKEIQGNVTHPQDNPHQV